MIQLAGDATTSNENPTSEAQMNPTGIEAPDINKVTDYSASTSASRVLQMVFVNDINNNDLEEQFSTEDENGAETEVDVTTHRITTTVDEPKNKGALNIVYMQRSLLVSSV